MEAKQLYGDTRTIAEALQIAYDAIGAGDVARHEEQALSIKYLLDELLNGRKILDPWSYEDVLAMTENDNGKPTLTDEQAVEVLTAFENNDYRTESGNEMLTDIAYELYGSTK